MPGQIGRHDRGARTCLGLGRNSAPSKGLLGGERSSKALGRMGGWPGRDDLKGLEHWLPSKCG